MFKLFFFYLTLTLFSILNAGVFNTLLSSQDSTKQNDVLMYINLDVLKTEEPVTLQISAQKSYTMKKTLFSSRTANSFTWFGEDINNKKNTIIVTVIGTRTLVKMTLDSVKYSLQQQDNDTFLLKHENQNAILQPFLDDYKTNTIEDETKVLSRRLYNTLPADVNESAPVTLKLLMLYTPGMLTFYGADINVTLQSLVDTANLGYANSETNVTLEVVDMQLLDNTSTSEGQTISYALTQLSTNSNLEIDKKRKIAGANLVTLVRRYSGTGSCGLAWLLDDIQMKNSGYPYSVVEVKSIDEIGSGTYCPDTTLIHEIGHNMGCAHDRDHETGSGLFDYSYGFDLPGTFATIMSYDLPGINYFSNPNITYEGNSIGSHEGNSDAADCAKTIRISKAYLARNLEYKEPLEIATDIQNGYDFNGTLFEQNDRDSYDVALNGLTTFTLKNNLYNLDNNYYPSFPMYLNIYDSLGLLITSQTADETFTYTFDEGLYTIVVSYTKDSENSWLLENPQANGYEIKISTQALTNINDLLTNVYLKQGWNLISINHNLDVLGSKVQLMWQYIDGEWSVYSSLPNIASEINNLGYEKIKEVNSSIGTWVHMEEDLVIETKKVKKLYLNINKDWQLVGTTSDISPYVFDNQCVDYVWQYNKENELTQPWSLHIANKIYLNSQKDKIAEISLLKKFEGYWVKGNTSCVIQTNTDIVPSAVIKGAKSLYHTSETLSLDASESSDNGSIVSYNWKLNGSVVSTNPTLSSSDLSSGINIVTLDVTDNFGQVSSESLSIQAIDSFTNLLPMDETGSIKSTSKSCINNDCTISLASGSKLSFEITNDTDRNYTISKFTIISTYNEVSTTRAFSTDTSLLSDGTLNAGESIELGYTLTSSQTANYWVGTYTLTDVSTGIEFINSLNWNATASY